MSLQEQLNEYDAIPMAFCAKCYSPKIKQEESLGIDVCGDCGCTEILETSVHEWEKLYENKYGHKYVTKGKDPKKSPVFKLTRSELMDRLYNLPQWKSIIHSLYSRFPGGLSKIDSIVLLFDKIAKDNRIDDLRIKLMEYIKG